MGYFVLLCFVNYVFINSCQGELSQKLHHYETLELTDIKSRIKRDTRLPLLDEYQEIQFAGFERQFHLKLTKADVLSSGFMTKVIHHDGQMTNVPLSHTHFYNGKLKGDKTSSCSLYIEDGVVTGSIITGEEEFFIEPLWRHKDGVNINSKTMIMYRRSDIIWSQNKSVCGSTQYNNSQTENTVNTTQSMSQMNFEKQTFQDRVKRQKRSILQNHKVCRILLVADYYFCKGIGGGFINRTMNYIIGLINNVNSIYKTTHWSADLTGVGFEIAGILIHDSYSTSEKYNMQNRDLDLSGLLNEFSKAYYNNQYCLVHLLTYQLFKGFLGLAYVASWRSSDLGGICSPDDHRYKQASNTGVSTSMNDDGERQVAIVAMATVAHELGHNWGSHHDPDTDECKPSVSNGGNFLMLSTSQMILFKNNLKFSPCSVRSIFKVLESKGYSCFTEENINLGICGNGRIDGGETCDSGMLSDSCCENCKLRPGAFCSPQNFPCCVNCRLASYGTPCYHTTDDDTDCKTFAVCTGNQLQCPEPGYKVNGTSCIDGGVCYLGRCQNFCEAKGQIPCLCSTESGKACHRCCKETVNGPCKAFSQFLRDGSYCDDGSCVSGVCVKSPSAVRRAWNVIVIQITNSFAIFMKNNIVLFVTLFTAIVFIPLVIFVNRWDSKDEEEDGKLREPLVERRDDVVLLGSGLNISRIAEPVKIRKTNSSPKKDQKKRLCENSSATSIYMRGDSEYNRKRYTRDGQYSNPYDSRNIDPHKDYKMERGGDSDAGYARNPSYAMPISNLSLRAGDYNVNPSRHEKENYPQRLGDFGTFDHHLPPVRDEKPWLEYQRSPSEARRQLKRGAPSSDEYPHNQNRYQNRNGPENRAGKIPGESKYVDQEKQTNEFTPRQFRTNEYDNLRFQELDRNEYYNHGFKMETYV